MVGYVLVLTLRLGVYTLCGKNKIKFGQIFFASPKHALPYTYDRKDATCIFDTLYL